MSQYTAKKSYEQSVLTGFITGALIGFRNGAKPAMLGGLGFGAFSAVIECLME